MSKPLILVVEDNADLLYAIKLTLKSNNYEVLTAKNGKEALNLLFKRKKNPDLIISDIMMPEMDGYEFFTNISKKPQFNFIPFLFLSAKTSPKEIRFGKMLGVDDYITKPFNDEDLLAIISGKLKRNEKVKSIAQKVDSLISNFNINIEASVSLKEKEKIVLLNMVWDDKIGPKLVNNYPLENEFDFSIKEIGSQLFHASLMIYGHERIENAEGILLHLGSMNMASYAYFNSYPKENERFGQKQYMLAVIAPNISYFHSLRIKELFNNVSKEINNQIPIDLEDLWKEILDILTSSIMPLNF